MVNNNLLPDLNKKIAAQNISILLYVLIKELGQIVKNHTMIVHETKLIMKIVSNDLLQVLNKKLQQKIYQFCSVSL